MTIIADRILHALPALVDAWRAAPRSVSSPEETPAAGPLADRGMDFLSSLIRDLEGEANADPVWRSLARQHGQAFEQQGADVAQAVVELQVLREQIWIYLTGLADEVGWAAIAAGQRRVDRAIDAAIVESVAAFVAQSCERWADLARRDGLTRLYNRSTFYDMLANEINRAGRTGGTFSVVMVDLNFFKRVNDTYGHLKGDQVLSDIAAILRETVRTYDTVFRYGGDEFALLLPDTAHDGARAILDRFAARLDAYRVVSDLPGLLGVSWGVAVYPHDATEPRALVAAADRRLYGTKYLTARPLAPDTEF